ncbi:MAG: hypothetical protein KC547_03995 [Anaerolineae bacterium]|nr:hypothetical protein [Anaerolineae bacterium]
MKDKPRSHQRRNIILLILVGILGVGVIFAAVLLPRLLTSYQAPTGFDGAASATPSTDDVSEADVAHIEQRLRAVGLAESGYLSSTGIATHLQRLRDKEVSLEALENYADDLEALTQISGQYGQPIPVTFWDVRTEDMTQNNLTEYDAVHAITGPDSPYLALISRAYNRLYDLKTSPETDTALDAALDIFQYTVAYYVLVSPVDFDNLDDEQRAEIAKGIVGVWQQVLVSSTRANPLTGKPMFSHSVFGHFNISSMWRYHVGADIGVGEIWGVSGFDQRFVGEPENNNQVEHMSISATLQLVLAEPLEVLNGIEERDILTGRESRVQAQADQNVNSAIAFEFIPYFADDYSGTIEHLRCVLASRAEDQPQCALDSL